MAPRSPARGSTSTGGRKAKSRDAAGRYEIHVPEPGYPLLVHAAGYSSLLVQGYFPAGVMRHELDLKMLPGGKLEGRVVAADDQPIAGAKVRASMDTAKRTPTGTS
jgi:hypothetical protein